MNPAKDQSNKIKHTLRTEHNLNLKQFAEQNGLKYRTVSEVVRGIRFGNYGEGREVADKIKEMTGITIN
jgi:gp16 family phage-associated protein